MKILILGAGQVGSSVAASLATEDNDITVVDTDAHRLRELAEKLDIRTVVGHASLPSVLAQAGAEEAELLVAVTSSDEVNLIACQFASRLTKTPTRVARLRQSEYLGLAMQEAGIVPDRALQHDAITTEEAGHAAALALIASGVPFDAVFAGSDLIAIGALRALSESGRRVPADVAVVGFDDIPAASHTNPPLTTIMQDIRGAGERLLEVLLAQIEGREQPGTRLPTRLIVRASTGG